MDGSGVLVERFLVALGCSAGIVWWAWRRGALSGSGGWAALGVGTEVLGLGGWIWGGMLGVFFFTSTALSKVKGKGKEAAAARAQKGDRRDGWQVLANGGWAALAALCGWLWPWEGWFLLAAGSLATATADTWATELGTLSRRAPRLITTGRRCAAGTSGGVTRLGLGAAGGGAAAIAVVCLGHGVWTAAAIWAGGFVGALVDSLLGATVQRLNRCDVCFLHTEREMHCGVPTGMLRGWRRLDNDGVNAAATLVGGIVAFGIWRW